MGWHYLKHVMNKEYDIIFYCDEQVEDYTQRLTKGKGFDAAEDFLNPSKIRAYVYETILPKLDDEALEQGSIFGECDCILE